MKKPPQSRGTNRWSPRARVLRDFRLGDEPADTARNSSKAADWLTEILDGFKLAEGLEEEKLREGWRRIAGDFIASQTQVVSLRRGCLVLRVLQPAMRFHLEQSKRDLLRRLQQEIGRDEVSEVKLVTG